MIPATEVAGYFQGVPAGMPECSYRTWNYDTLRGPSEYPSLALQSPATFKPAASRAKKTEERQK